MLLGLIDQRFSRNGNLCSQQSSLTTPILTTSLPMFGQNYSFTESMSFQRYIDACRNCVLHICFQQYSGKSI